MFQDPLEKSLNESRPRISPEEKTAMLSSIEEKITSPSPVPSPYFSYTFSRKVTKFLVFVLIFGSVGSVAASGSARPGDLLFPVELATERVQMAMTSEKRKDQLQMQFTLERLDELREILSEEGISKVQVRDSQADEVEVDKEGVVRISVAAGAFLDQLDEYEESKERTDLLTTFLSEMKSAAMLKEEPSLADARGSEEPARHDNEGGEDEEESDDRRNRQPDRLAQKPDDDERNEVYRSYQYNNRNGGDSQPAQIEEETVREDDVDEEEEKRDEPARRYEAGGDDETDRDDEESRNEEEIAPEQEDEDDEAGGEYEEPDSDYDEDRDEEPARRDEAGGDDDDEYTDFLVKADVYLDVTLIRVEVYGLINEFESTANTRDEVISEISEKYGVTRKTVSDALDFEFKNEYYRFEETSGGQEEQAGEGSEEESHEQEGGHEEDPGGSEGETGQEEYVDQHEQEYPHEHEEGNENEYEHEHEHQHQEDYNQEYEHTHEHAHDDGGGQNHQHRHGSDHSDEENYNDHYEEEYY